MRRRITPDMLTEGKTLTIATHNKFEIVVNYEGREVRLGRADKIVLSPLDRPDRMKASYYYRGDHIYSNQTDSVTVNAPTLITTARDDSVVDVINTATPSKRHRGLVVLAGLVVLWIVVVLALRFA